jgi:hypothetical protein
MTAASPVPAGSPDMPTLMVRDSQGRQLLCFLEQLIPLDGRDYALLTPVDTAVTVVRLPADEQEEPEEIVDWQERGPILEVAEAVLQEHNLTLVHSAATLTVTGDFEDPDLEEEEDGEEQIEEGEAIEDDGDGSGELFESLLDRPFFVGEEQYDLFVPLDPFFVVAALEGQDARLVEGEEFDRIQPRLEAELEAREWGD